MLHNWIAALIMGIVEGVTEFLPVSSTGHLLLMDEILHFQSAGNVFEIVIQFGAILAVVAVYFQRLWLVARNAPHNPQARRFIYAVLLAFLPAMAIGFFAHGFIKGVLFNPMVVAVSLIAGGIAILAIEKKAPVPTVHDIEEMPMKTAFYIGLAQCLAMIPGVSRSGATIMGSLLFKVDRKTAAEFSFFLAIPTMAAATAYDLYKNFGALTADDGIVIAIGFVTSFAMAWLVVRSFVGFVSRHGFAPFAWYRIVLGAVAMAALLW